MNVELWVLRAHTDRRQPVALRRTWDECRCNFWSSWACGEVSHPEWGMITALVSTARASWMMGIFRASQEDRFHRTPEEDSRDEAAMRSTAELAAHLDLPVNPEQIPHRSSAEELGGTWTFQLQPLLQIQA